MVPNITHVNKKHTCGFGSREASEFQGATREGLREGRGRERDQQNGVKQGRCIE